MDEARVTEVVTRVVKEVLADTGKTFDQDLESLDLEVREATHHAARIMYGIKDHMYTGSEQDAYLPIGDVQRIYAHLADARDIIREYQMNPKWQGSAE